MTEKQALIELQARVRDFSSWSGASLDDDWKTMDPIACRCWIVKLWSKATKGDPTAWVKGGYKRIDLDQALEVLGLPPLPFA